MKLWRTVKSKIPIYELANVLKMILWGLGEGGGKRVSDNDIITHTRREVTAVM